MSASARRVGGAVLVLLALVITMAPIVARAAPVERSSGPSAYDGAVPRSDCRLLGRRYVAGRGCARSRCVGGAVPFNPNRGAEMCATKRGRAPYGTTIVEPLCEALGRRWLDSMNYCASNPLRASKIELAPQCAQRGAVYVPLGEVEGDYDECLSTERAAMLTRIAREYGTSLAEETSRHSAAQCPTRPGYVYVDGVCQPSGAPPPALTDQTLLIGDSVAWRASDELARLRPTFALDGQPARKIEELAGRLAYYRSGHGDPTGLIVELGTNASRGYSRGDLDALVDSLPAATRVLFVLPFRRTAGAPAPAVRYGHWMRAVARSRAGTCVADWPRLVKRRPSLMLDEVHPTRRGERVYAGLVSRTWSRCG